jgi:DNA-directed RNA polymerase subunit RPC12/RpoP
MKCPNCDQEIPGEPCHHCGAVVPESANYCMQCGAHFAPEPEMMTEEADEVDFENRILCPDGTCTGILVDGRCSECGKEFGSGELDED